MRLTKNQRSNMFFTIGITAAAIVVVVICWLLVNSMSNTSQATVKTSPIPQVNVKNYEQIITGTDDGTVDHYCVGSDGLFFGQNTGDFSVMKNDPLCP